MSSDTSGSRYENVSFHFLGAEEDCDLRGNVIIRDVEMVLEVLEGDDAPYTIVGATNQHWFEGINVRHDAQYETKARWAVLTLEYGTKMTTSICSHSSLEQCRIDHQAAQLRGLALRVSHPFVFGRIVRYEPSISDANLNSTHSPSGTALSRISFELMAT